MPVSAMHSVNCSINLFDASDSVSLLHHPFRKNVRGSFIPSSWFTMTKYKVFFFLATDYCVYRKQELSFFSREKKRSRPSLLGCSTHEFPEGPQRQLAMATTANSEDLEHTLPRNGYIGAFGHFVLFVFVRVRIPSKSIFVETISHYKCV